MPQQDLHEANVDTLFQEPGGKAVAKRGGCEVVIETARRPGPVEGLSGRPAGKRTGAFSVDEELRGAAMDLPHLTENGERRFGQGQDSLFVAFADDPQEHLLGVDGGDGQGDGFTDPQAAGVDQGETAAVDRSSDRGDQAAAVFVTSDVRKALAIRLADFFFVSSGQS